MTLNTYFYTYYANVINAKGVIQNVKIARRLTCISDTRWFTENLSRYAYNFCKKKKKKKMRTINVESAIIYDGVLVSWVLYRVPSHLRLHSHHAQRKSEFFRKLVK